MTDYLDWKSGGGGGGIIETVTLPLEITGTDLSINAATESTSGVVIIKNTYPSTISTTDATTSTYVQSAIAAAITGGSSFRGGYDASTNLFPATGGSGTASAIKAGDYWVITVAGILGGTPVVPNDQVLALVNTPGQTAANWNINSAQNTFNPAQFNVLGGAVSIKNSAITAALLDSTATPTFAGQILTNLMSVALNGSTTELLALDATANKNIQLRAKGTGNVRLRGDTIEFVNQAGSVFLTGTNGAFDITGQTDITGDLNAENINASATLRGADLNITDLLSVALNGSTTELLALDATANKNIQLRSKGTGNVRLRGDTIEFVTQLGSVFFSGTDGAFEITGQTDITGDLNVSGDVACETFHLGTETFNEAVNSALSATTNRIKFSVGVDGVTNIDIDPAYIGQTSITTLKNVLLTDVPALSSPTFNAQSLISATDASIANKDIVLKAKGTGYAVVQAVEFQVQDASGNTGVTMGSTASSAFINVQGNFQQSSSGDTSFFAGNVRFGGVSAPTNAVSVTGSVDISQNLSITGNFTGGKLATITPTNVACANDDTINVCVNKLQGQINNFSGGGASFSDPSSLSYFGAL